MEGNIVVDGVLASCYASFDHTLSHTGMTHMRWFPKIMEFTFGEENGIQGFAQIAEGLDKWLLPFQQ